MSNILIIYGGKSCEHDISVITGCLARGYFSGKLYSAYLSEENVCYLVPNNFSPTRHLHFKGRKQIVFMFGRKQLAIVRGRHLKYVNIDVVVNCCHGRCGEDGAIASLCELCGVPIVGSDVISSALSMDKVFSKHVLSAFQIPVLPGIVVRSEHTSEDLKKVEQLGFPIIVKPATLGSSIGISVCKDVVELQCGLEKAFVYDDRVLCEKALTNFYELNCSAMRVDGVVRTSNIDSPFSSGEILSFYDKYQRGEKFGHSRREVSDKNRKQVIALTERIYNDFSLAGVVRVDFLVDCVTDKIYVNEINSIPGSLAYGLWQNTYSLREFGRVLIEQAEDAFARRNKLKTKFESSVLDGVNMSKK